MHRILIISLFAPAAFAQSGTIRGKITDPDANVVKNAIVRLTNTATGAKLRTDSAANGDYSITAPAGTYDLAVPMPCCQWGSYAQSNVVIRAGETLALDIHLPWGANLGALADDPILEANALREKAPILTGPAPRAPNGEPDLSGIWINVYNPDTPGAPPLQPWASALFKQRMENNSKDYPGAYCLPANAEPITRAYPYRIVQTPTHIVFLFDEDTPGVRQVFMNMRAHPPDWSPTWGGHSIGRWDGDTLVIDTAGYNDKSWLSLTGIPHTGKLHTVTRIRRVDFGHIAIEVLMEDQDAFTGPWKRSWTATLAPADTQIAEFICGENNRDVEHYRDK
jgi:hypothetical protein